MDFKGMVDKRAILILLGCYCRDMSLVLDKRTETAKNDYPEEFHKTIFGAIFNLAKKGHKTISSYEIEAEISPFNGARVIWEKNDGMRYVEEAIEQSENKVLNAHYYKEEVRKYAIIRVANEIGLDTRFIYNEEDEAMLENFSLMTSSDIFKEINHRYNRFKDSFKEDLGTKQTVKVGEKAKELLERFKKQEDVYGFPFEGDYMNSAFKGQRMKKFILSSGSSGSGRVLYC